MFPPERERGAALLTVLLMVAIISVLAATALEKLRLSTRLAGNAAATEQARAYALAAETLATTRIGGLLAQRPDRITLAGGWSDRPFALPLPNGFATAQVSDGGNCFNLNSLVNQAGPGVYAAFPVTGQEFERLMRLLGAPADQAQRVVAAATDWIDTDGTEQPDGAEDGAYGGKPAPYRPPNTLMADVSELRAVQGMTPDLYAKLRPWVCALPTVDESRINVDTLLPEQAPLVAMLYPDTLSVAQAQAAILKRPAEGWADAGTLLQSFASTGTTAGPALAGQVTTTTTWFALDIRVRAGDAELQERALVDATTLPPRLVSRQWGEAS